MQSLAGRNTVGGGVSITCAVLVAACLISLESSTAGQPPLASQPAKTEETDKKEIHVKEITSQLPSRDDHSYARPDQVAIRHLELDLTVDFETRRLSGHVVLHLDRKSPTSQLHLDAARLDVSRITDESGDGLSFVVGEGGGYLGEGLTIDLLDDSQQVKIEYTTAPQAAAVQWLSPQQTTGRKHPFLFTQSQAILARTWIPCQDTPSVRMTYEARIQVPAGLLAIMSATNPQRKSSDGCYQFEMKQAIPSYLLALAVGDLEFKSLGPRSGVYAEPGVLEKSAWEFADTEQMILTAEQLYGPYAWDRYDLVVLPPSFPFGGMENPRLTFATPTILAGDRSLVSLVAHELAHSWSGNLVTNATWNDFWLNEGFTVYFEQRIMEALYGRRYAEMLAKLSLAALQEELEELDERDTWLHLDLKGRDPDDGMTAIAYDKGYFFLRMLEERLGRKRWDAFLRSYFTKYAFKSMTTHQFLAYMDKELLSNNPELTQQVALHDWVFGPGLPSNCPQVDSPELDVVSRQAETFLAGAEPSEISTAEWTTHHWLHFLRALDERLTACQMTKLDTAFDLTKSDNSEILSDWLRLAIQADYAVAFKSLKSFLTRQGRRKFLTPLYKELVKTPAGKELALSIYEVARPMYHPISRATIDDVLSWNSNE